jgi:hypothetical protein
MGDAQLFNIADSGLVPAGPASERWLRQQKRTQIWMKAVSDQKARSLDQNALQWKWYGEIAAAMPDTPEWAHCYCKLHFGIPILRRDSDRFRAVYDRYLKPLMYEQKMRVVELISVTSLFTVPQATEYMDAIVRYAAENDIALTIPDF